MLQGLSPDEPTEALEAVEAQAVELSNAMLEIPGIPLAELQAIDELIRRVQALILADQIVQAELQAMVDLSHHVLRKKADEDAIIALLMMG
jgi:hypothetical protein